MSTKETSVASKRRQNTNKSSPSNEDTSQNDNQNVPVPPSQSRPTPNAASTDQQQRAGFGSLIQVIFQAFVFWYLFTWLFKGKEQTSGPSTNINFAIPDAKSPDAASTIRNSEIPVATQLLQLWPQHSSMDMRVYISEKEEFLQFEDPTALVWHVPGIRFGDWEEEHEKALEMEITSDVQRNGTLYAHIYLTLERASPNPADPGYQSNMRVYQRKLLTRYFPKRKEIKTKKLIGGSEEETENEQVKPTNSSAADDLQSKQIISYWCQNLTLSIISDNALIPYSQMPPVITSEIPLEHNGMKDPSGKYGYYLPIVYVNDFWILKEHMTPINETVTTLPLNLKYYPISFMKFQLYAQMQESFRTQAEVMGGNAHSEFDEIKRMLLETNPFLLGITFVVSILHSLFEFLAFKNDISDWKNKKELTGISIRTIFMNIFFQLIIFLYLFDNNEDTSWMILIGQGIGLAIEVWKIKKAIAIEIKPSKSRYFPYSIRFIDKHKLSEMEIKTQDLIYKSHKSWYSFVVATLVGFVYAFGFIMMTPQLFINYKLKSVAHMPWKTLMYKTLGTFVDDLFAFCIKMPMLHRLACLRDDVVFFVYIYQRWIYPVDKKRANEYGQVGEVDSPGTDINGHQAPPMIEEEAKKEK
ncbi:hypothetical protein G9A89_002612 [Geosiphon pyriformis]|nr:hypothetical protein G9A89_002612 [Geosiphon pyriformis]